jgi:DNA recombination protein RmuC
MEILLLVIVGLIIVLAMVSLFFRWNIQQQRTLAEFKEAILERQMESMKTLHDVLQNGTNETRQLVQISLKEYSDELGKRTDKLTEKTDQRLKEISGQVEKRLTEGFEKTTETFTDVIKRLALIDEAQKKITELSTNVVSLQEVLSDKKSRGAFGEVQLSNLIHNMIPANSFSLQHTLSNGKRADCMLFLPEPTGNIAIDAKFPLENYRQMIDMNLDDHKRTAAERQFRVVIQKHIQDISSKYIIPEETSDGAVMFIPAEAVFAEIHAHFPDLVEKAHKARVWMVSPTTMMAILTTTKAVLKDEATRKQVHIIREHLGVLAKDFDRFQLRMNNLAKHVKQAHEDAEKVHKSAQKISSRFSKIEKVELDNKDQKPELISDDS